MTVSRELKVLSHTMRPFAADTATPPGLLHREVKNTTSKANRQEEGGRQSDGRGGGGG